MAEEQLKDVSRSSVNLGIAPETNALPEVEIHRGTPDQFSRPATYLPGHARLSPGDFSPSEPSTKSEQPGQADPLDDPTPTPHPVRAEDFARGFSENVPGQQKPSPGSPPSRGPVTPGVALFGAAGARFDFGQLTPVEVRNMPNNDDGAPMSTQPTITKAPEATAPWGPPDAWRKE
ncbi:MAG TPA: hypothetical protein VNZ26_25770 [Vicinamibacterales bacterium]|jgi:hypothetical protein|nr:hypothetical protein [Vicinamibacterales bacterium]